MDLRVTKNIQFTRLIKAPVQQKEFNFRRIPNTKVDTFHVDVSDEKMNRIMFQVQKDSTGHWKIVDHALPMWISGVEPKLDEILENDPAVKKHIDFTEE
jgi:hypothetical protein